jgi:Ca-activated chloride channel family protein
LPDLFAGVPLTVFGRYKGKAKGTITLSASDDAGQPITRRLEANVSTNAAMSKIWARGRLRDMEDSWVIGDYEAKEALLKNILVLSLKFGVLCRFTAFVAVDRAETVNKGGKRQQLMQPVELPESWVATPPAMSKGIAGASMVCRSGGPFMNTFAGLSAEEMPEDAEMELCEGLDGGDEVTNGHETNGNGHEPHAEEESVETPAIEVDLTAYRQRAQEMLAGMRADSNPAHALGVLRLRLQALVEDLQSIGADAAVIEPLAKLLEKLKPNQLSNPAVHLKEIEKVLTTFVDSVAKVA